MHAYFDSIVHFYIEKNGAIDKLVEAVEHSKKLYGDNSPFCVLLLNKLTEFYMLSDQLQKAKDNSDHALSLLASYATYKKSFFLAEASRLRAEVADKLEEGDNVSGPLYQTANNIYMTQLLPNHPRLK